MRVNKKAKTALWGLAVFSVVALFVFVAFVFGAQVVLNSAEAGLNFTFAEDASGLVNLSINITGPEGQVANISELIIELYGDTNFTDSAAFNSTNASGTTTTTTLTNTTLNWSSTTGLLINATPSDLNYFWFSVTGITPVKFGNITVITMNYSGDVDVSNITLSFNDSMTIDFIGNTPAGGTNVSQNYIEVSVNISGNDTGVSLELRFFNSSQNTAAQTNITINLNTTELPFVVNFTNITGGLGTGLPDGTYYINATLNNSQLDENVTITRTIIIDTTKPTVTLAQDNAATATTKTKITVDITIADTNGISQTCSSTTNEASISGTGTAQTLTQESLTCGTGYTYAITCTDSAGNVNAAVEVTATTSSCGGSGGSGGNGGGGTTWTNTFVEDDEELSVKGDVTKELGEKHRIKLKIGGETHFVGVIDGGLTGTSATIQVSSEHEQEATLDIGETVKFDVLDDGFYDLSVTLSSIENNKASLTVSAIHEEVVEEVEEGSGVTETVDRTVSDVAEALGTSKGVAWVLILVVIVVIILVIVYFVRKNKGKVSAGKR